MPPPLQLGLGMGLAKAGGPGLDPQYFPLPLTSGEAHVTQFAQFSSAGTDHVAFGDLVWVPSKSQYLAVYRQGTDHFPARDGVVKTQWLNEDGTASGSAATISTGTDWRDARVSRLRDGRLVITESRTPDNGATYEPHVFVSSDNGTSWTAYAITTATLDGNIFLSGRVIEYKGKWLIGAYDKLASPNVAYVLEYTLGEASTPLYEVLDPADTDAAGNSCNETYIQEKPGGELLAFVRQSTSDRWHYLTSSDGQTWSLDGNFDLFPANTDEHHPAFNLCQNGEVVMAERDESANRYVALVCGDYATDTFARHVLDGGFTTTYFGGVRRGEKLAFVLFRETVGGAASEGFFGAMEQTPAPALSEISGEDLAFDGIDVSGTSVVSQVGASGTFTTAPNITAIDATHADIVFDGTQYATFGAAADWTFLHDLTSGDDVFLGARLTLSNAAGAQTVFSTNVGSGEHGVTVWGDTGAFRCLIGRGVVGQPIADVTIASFFTGAERTMGVWIRPDKEEVWLMHDNGRLWTKAAFARNTYSTTAASRALHVGAVAGPSQIIQSGGKISRAIIAHGSAIDRGEVGKLMAWLRNT